MGADKDWIGKNTTRQKYKIQIHPQKRGKRRRDLKQLVGWCTGMGAD